MNLVTDIFPALALGMGRGDPLAMDRPPRDPESAVLERRHWRAIAWYGLMITGSVLAVLFIGRGVLGLDTEAAVTASFLTLALAQLWHVFNMRGRGTRFIKNEVTSNPYVWGAVVLCLGLIGSAVYVPALQNVLSIVPPNFSTWLLIAGFSVVPLVVGQIVLSSGSRRPSRSRTVQ